ncbi:MAG: ABC transporter ATP-binding protein [Oscillibacter sp.]|nr:ABC transporter ATP-binding protein [Oscillibacter sp.]
MLELSHVSACYGKRQVLRDINLAVHPGELLALIGPNGSGKSTLIRTAMGLHPYTDGAVTLDGAPIRSLSLKMIARKAAWLPQSRNVPDITAWRMVLHGRFPHMAFPRHLTQEDYKIAAKALEEVDGLSLADCLLRDLSGGERQKVYLAMALAQECGTILMDEPTTFLDIFHQIQVLNLAKRLAQSGKAVALVLHDLPLAFSFADRVALLHEGQLLQQGTPEDLLASDRLPAVFGVDLRKIWDGNGWQYYCVGTAIQCCSSP